MDPDRICAVVVTYNRRELLRECLQALLAQAHPLAGVLIVNNVSTDGTLEMLAREFPAERFPQVGVLNLPRNVGGAGGFHEGVKHAHAQGRYDWVWLMDDDTIPERQAAGELLTAHRRFPEGSRPVLLASKVLWTDGTLHAMNVPWVDQRDADRFYLAVERSAVALRAATFVSVLIASRMVEQLGLPMADYFVWGDDTEYTARVLKDHFGVLVPASRVLHKTAAKHSTIDAKPDRFYLYVRNNLWMILFSPAWTRTERVKSFVQLARFIVNYLQKNRYGWAGWKALFRGLGAGLSHRPKC